MSWKPEVFVDGKWTSNGMAFATEDEARRWAAGLHGRWLLAAGYRAVESTEPVSYELPDSSVHGVAVLKRVAP